MAAINFHFTKNRTILEYYEDDNDDSNDENNWRNEYPDEEDENGNDYFDEYDHGKIKLDF